MCNTDSNNLRYLLNELMEGMCSSDEKGIKILNEIIITVIIDSLLKTTYFKKEDLQAKFVLVQAFNKPFCFKTITKIRFLENMLLMDYIKEKIAFIIFENASNDKIKHILTQTTSVAIPQLIPEDKRLFSNEKNREFDNINNINVNYIKDLQASYDPTSHANFASSIQFRQQNAGNQNNANVNRNSINSVNLLDHVKNLNSFQKFDLGNKYHFKSLKYHGDKEDNESLKNIIDEFSNLRKKLSDSLDKNKVEEDFNNLNENINDFKELDDEFLLETNNNIKSTKKTINKTTNKKNSNKETKKKMEEALVKKLDKENNDEFSLLRFKEQVNKEVAVKTNKKSNFIKDKTKSNTKEKENSKKEITKPEPNKPNNKKEKVVFVQKKMILNNKLKVNNKFKTVQVPNSNEIMQNIYNNPSAAQAIAEHSDITTRIILPKQVEDLFTRTHVSTKSTGNSKY